MQQQQNRRTETADRSRTTRQESRKNQPLREGEALALQLALDVLRAGGSLEQLPAEAVLALSGRIGNSALLSLLTRREPEPAPPVTFPAGLDTAPLPVPDLTPDLTAGPDFGAAPLETAAALVI